MKRIRSKAEYFKLFAEPDKALARAELVRDVELDLYWRRAAYFWAFSAAAFAGYFALATVEKEKPELLVIASCLGTAFSWVWYLANRGGKYWQNNWEHQIDLLEELSRRPIYKANLYIAPRIKWSPLLGYPWSVSRLNHLLSLYITIAWGIIAVFAAADAGIGFQGRPTSASIVAMLTVLFLVLSPRAARRRQQETTRKVELDIREYELNEEPD